jgi:hypothetical protein
MARVIFIILVLVLSAGTLNAQAGKSDKLWSDCWSEDKEHHKAVVGIWCRLDAITTSGGSGCLLEGKSVITAFHVVDGAQEIKVKFHDGTSAVAVLKRCYASDDLAFLELASEPPASCTHSKLSGNTPEIGDEVEVCGLSGGEGLRHFKAKFLGSDESRLVLSGYVAQGDSGGPIFNSSGEVISVVSGGCLWIRNKTVSGKAGGAKVTTPIIGPVAAKYR